MNKIKLRAPPGASSYSHGGITYPIENGAVEVPNEDIAAAAKAHGLTPWDAPETRDVADMDRAQLQAETMRRLVEKLNATDTEAMRQQLKDTSAPHDTGARPGAGPDDDDHEPAHDKFSDMSKSELVAYLKARGVAVLPAHGLASLQRMARNADKAASA